MTNAEAWFNNSLRPWKPEGSLGQTAQDGHRDSHTMTMLAQRTSFNALDNWGHKIPTQSKWGEKDRKEKVKGSWPGTHTIHSVTQGNSKFTRKFSVLRCTVRTTDRINFPGHFAQQQRLKIYQTHRTYYNHSNEKSQWEHTNAKFYTDYTDLEKSESTNILAIQVREHLNKKYQNQIKIFYWWFHSGLIRQWSRIRYS